MDIYNIVKLFGQQYPKSIKVDAWDTVVVAGLIDISQYNYLYFEEKQCVVSYDDPFTELIVHKTTLKHSSFYYINSYVETLEDLKAKHNRKDDKIIGTMENMGWDRIVRNVDPKNNSVYEFRDIDKLINLKGCFI